MSSLDERIIKARVAAASNVIEHEILDGMIVGIGSGKTIEILIELLARFVKSRGIMITCIPSSYRTQMLLLSNNMRTASLYEYPSIDLTIDSFDESDQEGNVIKGGGAALTREKIIAHAADRVVYIADYKKMKDVLSMPVPLEVIPFGLPYVNMKISKMGGRLVVREGSGKFGPVFSDNGNIIADADIGKIEDPPSMERELKMIAGVIENGIFSKTCHTIYIGMEDGSVKRMDVR